TAVTAGSGNAAHASSTSAADRCVRAGGLGRAGKTSGCQRMLSVLRRKSAVAPWVGLLASGWQPSVLSSLHLPRPRAEWLFEATVPVTVAEPRRTRTGLPCYARPEHPRPDRYSACGARTQFRKSSGASIPPNG